MAEARRKAEEVSWKEEFTAVTWGRMGLCQKDSKKGEGGSGAYQSMGGMVRVTGWRSAGQPGGMWQGWMQALSLKNSEPCPRERQRQKKRSAEEIEYVC